MPMQSKKPTGGQKKKMMKTTKRMIHRSDLKEIDYSSEGMRFLNVDTVILEAGLYQMQILQIRFGRYDFSSLVLLTFIKILKRLLYIFKRKNA